MLGIAPIGTNAVSGFGYDSLSAATQNLTAIATISFGGAAELTTVVQITALGQLNLCGSSVVDSGFNSIVIRAVDSSWDMVAVNENWDIRAVDANWEIVVQ